MRSRGRTLFARVLIPFTPSFVICALAGLREIATTSHPSSRSMIAVARPMPDVPPNTRAFLPLTFIGFRFDSPAAVAAAAGFN